MDLHFFTFIAAAIHGDKDQGDRNKIMFAFQNQNLPILIATDLAARGLDIKSIKNVINYDTAKNIESHTHRIGRTGRAGEKGVAHTLITRKEVQFAGELVRNLEGANQYVPPGKISTFCHLFFPWISNIYLSLENSIDYIIKFKNKLISIV